jgi:hypothetical protein
MSHQQTAVTRAKIGKSKARSAWRRQALDKSSEAPSVAGNYDEDYQTPHRQRVHMPLLWEERP